MSAGRAPGDLGLVQAFVNTLDIDQAREDIGTPAALGEWFAERGLLDEHAVSEAEHRSALELREALRRLLLANNGGAPQPGDLAVLNRMALESGLGPRFTAERRVSLQPAAGGVMGALGRLLAVVSTAMNDGSWNRLKACAEHGCQWAFFDRSKNRSGHWCSMQSCGNRAKARQFRQRRAGVR